MALELKSSLTVQEIQNAFNLGLTASQNIKLILDAALNQDITDVNQLAYILATVKTETGNFTPITEKYWVKGATQDQARIHFDNKYNGIDGNIPGTDDGYTYRGHGFVQLTGRANYQNMGNILGVDLIDNPDLALDPNIAAQIADYGMLNGSFTGKKLSDYINDTTVDFYNARRIINGYNYNTKELDQGKETKATAIKYQQILEQLANIHKNDAPQNYCNVLEYTNTLQNPVLNNFLKGELLPNRVWN